MMDEEDFFDKEDHIAGDTPSLTSKESLLLPDNNLDASEVSKKPGEGLSPHRGYVIALTFFAAIGGFLFGYDTGVISGALLMLKELFNLNSVWQELIVSVTVGGAIVGALTGGWCTDQFGRKSVLLFASLVFTGGAVLMAVTAQKEVILVGRMVVGLAIGLSSMSVPMYIAEAASPSIRGTLMTINVVFITFGQCVAAIVDGLFSKDKINGWRYMLGLSGVPSLIMLVGLIFMPESPRWLASKGDLLRAEDVLVKLRGTSDVEDELVTIVQSFERSREEESEVSMLERYSRVFRTYYTRRALIIGCSLQAIQQLSGINTIMYYSATIIAMAGVHNSSQAIWLAVAVAAGNFLFTFVGLWLIDKVGRRKLTLISLAGVTLALILMAVMFHLMRVESPKVRVNNETNICSGRATCFDCVDNPSCGFCYISAPTGRVHLNGTCLPVNVTARNKRPSFCGSDYSSGVTGYIIWITGACPTKYAWLAPFLMIFYLAMFAPGMGPMPWAINGEIYPLWARSVGTSTSTATCWFFNLLVSISFLHLLENLGRVETFIMYAIISCAGWIFLFFSLPETKARTLEEMEELFMGTWFVPFKEKRGG